MRCLLVHGLLVNGLAFQVSACIRKSLVVRHFVFSHYINSVRSCVVFFLENAYGAFKHCKTYSFSAAAEPTTTKFTLHEKSLV